MKKVIILLLVLVILMLAYILSKNNEKFTLAQVGNVPQSASRLSKTKTDQLAGRAPRTSMGYNSPAVHLGPRERPGGQDPDFVAPRRLPVSLRPRAPRFVNNPQPRRGELQRNIPAQPSPQNLWRPKTMRFVDGAPDGSARAPRFTPP